MQDFHKLQVWRKAHVLVLRIYVDSNKLPPSENFGLTQHLRRAAVSIARSIAEGAGRDTNHDFIYDLRRSSAAAHELEYIILLCRDLGFFPTALHDELLAELIEVRRMISGLISKLNGIPEPLR